jgi:DNA polymerase phi
VKLISALQQFQSQHTSLHDGQSPDKEKENETQDQLDVLNAPDVSYSIRRLIRGLASPRDSSRIGFAVALTEVRR